MFISGDSIMWTKVPASEKAIKARDQVQWPSQALHTSLAWKIPQPSQLSAINGHRPPTRLDLNRRAFDGLWLQMIIMHCESSVSERTKIQGRMPLSACSFLECLMFYGESAYLTVNFKTFSR